MRPAGILCLKLRRPRPIQAAGRHCITSNMNKRPRFPSFALPLVLAATALFFVAVPGCGPRSDRLEVSGTVNLNGVPLDEGAIRLTSTGSEKLFASGAMVQNGEFKVPQEKGLPPGTYLVEISAPDTKAPLAVQKTAPGEPALPPTAPERIPAEYNSQSKHTVEVSADSDNHFVFNIQGRPAS